MQKRPIFRPELSLELQTSSKQKGSVITIKSTDDTLVVLDSIKELTTDHLAIIYLDQENTVLEVDTFLRGINEFTTEQATRALASVIYNQNSGIQFQVILAQTVQEGTNSLSDSIKMNNLANFAARLLLVNVKLVDCILIGKEEYFSFRRNKSKWIEFSEQLQLRK